MSNIILITTTFETKQEAEKMAKIVLSKRLAACAQVSGPTTSFYWWLGKIENAQEYILSLKSKEILYNKLEELIIDKHPYDTPEIVVTKVKRCSQKYREWMEKELLSG